MKKYLFLVLLLAVCSFSWADVYHCPVLSAGAQTTTPGPSFHNLGQVVAGRATNATTIMVAGSMACLRVETDCLLCDVNNDGLKNGLDVQGYVDVLVSGTGTPLELCASSPAPAAFVACLLNP
jgi:hypothetical protein